MDHTISHDGSCSCSKGTASSVTQTLQELDFERGIWSAASEGDCRKVEKLLKKGYEADKRDQSGYTALHYSCRNNHKSCSELLVTYGADVNSTTRSGGATPLHRAAYMGHSDMVDWLLRMGANPCMQDKDGKTALHKSAEKGHIDICKLLLDAEPDLSKVTDKKGMKAEDLMLDVIDKK